MTGPGLRMNVTPVTLPPPKVTPVMAPVELRRNFIRGANQRSSRGPVALDIFQPVM
jgi:hypothetical protein